MKPNVYIAGTGNLASALGEELKEKSSELYHFSGWISRKPLQTSLSPAYDYNSAPCLPGDVVFLCVQDKQIFTLAPLFANKGVHVIHCSGAQPLEHNGIKCDAAFWPMQTFRSGIQSSWNNIPVFLQTKNDSLAHLLTEMGSLLGANIIVCNEEERLKMHLTAVLANNFVNALIRSAEITAESTGYSAEFIYPILQQTVINAIENGAKNSQTGPAVRGDRAVMEKHIQLLENQPEMLKVYEDLSAYISILFK